MKLAKLLFISLLLIGVASGLGRAILSESSAAAETEPQVKIGNFSFTPPQLTVTKGTMVVWQNDDDVPHTVVGTQGEFKSNALDTGDRFSFTFAKPGTYKYFCSVHPMMTGEIVVK